MLQEAGGPRSQLFFYNRERPKRQITCLFPFSCSELVLQITNGFVYVTLSSNRLARCLLTVSELVNSQLRLLHFYLFDWLKNSDYEPIVGVLRHMENSAPSLKIFAL